MIKLVLSFFLSALGQKTAPGKTQLLVPSCHRSLVCVCIIIQAISDLNSLEEKNLKGLSLLFHFFKQETYFALAKMTTSFASWEANEVFPKAEYDFLKEFLHN